MTYMKAIAGHSSSKFIRHYLFKNQRALERDFLNLVDRDRQGRDWAEQMNETRHAYGNDVPVKEGQKVRTYEHIIVALDEKDRDVDIEDFRDMVNEWAARWFDSRDGAGVGRFQVAIAYHDDNSERLAEGKEGILHAHLVINNTDFDTGRRISGLMTTKRVQEMRADLQKISLDYGLHAFATDGKSYTAREMAARNLKPSRGKYLDRRMEALEEVMRKDEVEGDVEATVDARLTERTRVAKMVPETYRPGTDKPGFAYTTIRFSDGRTTRMVVPRALSKRETMAERQAKSRDGWSWKDDVKDRVDIALRISEGPKDFSSKLSQMGVTVNYNRDDDLVYHHPSDPDARKVKGSTLGHAYTADSVEQALAEKYASRRQRAHGLRDRERWMTEDERSAALAIARSAEPCTQQGAELIGRLRDVIDQADAAPRADRRHVSHVEYPSSLASSLGIEYPKTTSGTSPTRRPKTEDEILEAMADARDEQGFGGLAANNPPAASNPSGSTRGSSEPGTEIHIDKSH